MMNKINPADDIKEDGGSGKTSGSRNMLLYAAVTAALICIFFAFGSMKKGYHCDEMFTFGLSNHLYSLNESIDIAFYDGSVYSGQELWDEYLTVRDGGRFDYANVLANQAADVHPPLYYIFIHTVSSLFPDLSLIWTGLLVNVVFDIIIYWQLVWTGKKLGLSKAASMILAASFVLCAGFIGYAVVFFRMYALLAVWINFLVMLFFKSRPEDKAGFKYYLSFAAVLIGGSYTQYYFIIFAFFACLTYAVFVVLHKNWKKLVLSLAAAAAAGGVFILIWPSSLYHIFAGYRGTEAMDNALARDNFGSWAAYFTEGINSGIFGGLFAVILALLICLLIIGKKRAASRTDADAGHTQIYRYALLAVPVCLYVVVIARVAPFKNMRYVVSVCALLYIALFGAMINTAGRISKKAGAAVMVLAVLVTLAGYRNGIDNLYTAETKKTETIAGYKETPCFYLYEHWSKYQILWNLQELKELDSIVFATGNNWYDIIASKARKVRQADCEEIVVYISNRIDIDHKDALAYIKEACGFSESTKLFNAVESVCYVLN